MPASEELFDRSEEYDAMLEKGLRLTGEDKDYFLHGRLDLVQELLPSGFALDRILDFGCGTGDTSAALAARFPDAHVTGVDTAEQALRHATQHHGGPRIDFREVSTLDGDQSYDLCYVNGVFHHIPDDMRSDALDSIRRALRPEGVFTMFENNPWNPGTRLVMSRIAFDRDAVTISPREAVGLLGDNGFEVQGRPHHLFFFPAPLKALRGLEPHMRWIPLGGQYVVVATPDRSSAVR